MTNGIDVSKHQGKIDWDAVKASGVQFAILRAGYGKYVSQKDATFEFNYAECKRVGLPVGAYWYSYAATVADVKAEMQAFLAAIKGKTFEYPVYFDQEYEPAIKALTNAKRTQLVQTALDTLQAAGYYAGLYASANWVNQWLNPAELTQYDLWAAQYGANCGAKLPFGIWQHTSTGRVAGISGNVDCNRAYKDYPAIIKAAGLNGFAKSKPADETNGTNTATPDKPAVTPLYQLTIGPMTAGDKATLTNAAKALGLPVYDA